MLSEQRTRPLVGDQRACGGAASGLSAGIVAPWLLIALSPVILVLTTSNPFDPSNIVQYFFRRFGIPVVGVEIAVIGLAVAAGTRPLTSLGRAPPWSRATLSILIVLAFSAAVLAPVANTAFLHLSLTIVHLLFGLSVAGLARQAPQRVRTMFWPAIVVGLTAYAALLTLYVALIPDSAHFDWLAFGFGVVNIRHTGFFLTVGISASLGLALIARRPRVAILAASATTLFFALAFWAGSRGSLVPSWVAALLMVILFKRFRKFRSIAIISAASVIGLFLSRLHHVANKHYGMERLTQIMGSGSLDNAASGRLEVWRGTWNAILDQPWLGHGQGQLMFVVSEARPLAIYHPHNSVLQVTFEWGIPGALCFGALLLYLCWRCLKVLGDDPGPELPAFLTGTALLFMSLHDGALFFTYPIFMVVVALAWIVGIRTSSEPVIGGRSAPFGID